MPLPLLALTPALMPLPLKVPTLVPRRTPIKMAMLRIIESIQSPTLTKSRIRKGSQMVLLERKKLKAQFPNTSENMNVLQFLGFRSDEIKHLFSMVLTYTSAQREYSHNTDYARAVKRCLGSVSVGLARKYRIGGWLGKH
ncbi:ADI_G0014860.mRNA.1.CDS.1 [Saccharomyces cerevisiae]|nr:ADI_G0014860.mRNA.1.CDS.1 [Saccharomyces cerevisiae]CAI6631811.1 ADI_G0014860.mRNA.1.CDS.1 [Saccharomyces cerevisiae]